MHPIHVHTLSVDNGLDCVSPKECAERGRNRGFMSIYAFIRLRTVPILLFYAYFLCVIYENVLWRKLKQGIVNT